MTAPHPLIEQLTARQTELDVTTTALFRRTGIACATVYNWRAGRRTPRLQELISAGEALGLRLTWERVEVPVDGWEVEPDEQLPYGELVLDENEKFCSGCGQVRSRRDDFHQDRSKRDGLKSACKYCHKDRREQRARQAGEAAA
ncbi:hypothetical protein [Thermomonospora umbrina]|uniref:Helix-turn-helix protein n=1 Tax=Thermomonospora umbrina TaxID=111806 RepID=A0A3D9T4U2_9ACTN|nr:hypothetical protein [Thermomonospora umbrina]REF00266.1 hypothetical protein DFJ69_5795 [Thermomonospora umbrina]